MTESENQPVGNGSLEMTGGKKRVRLSLTQGKSQGRFRDSGKKQKFPNDFKEAMPRSGNASGKTDILSRSRAETAINARYNGLAERRGERAC
jgi:hypothetical protein